MQKSASAPARAPGLLPGLFLLAWLGLLVFLALSALDPPPAASVGAPPGEFSAGRAMAILQSIARKPHPLGSAELTIVRKYLLSRLVQLGLRPKVQKTTSVGSFTVRPYRAATVYNVVARLKGTGEARAILLVAHYDSVPTGPGASDDGVAVAAILETLRALKAGVPLRNDVIVLFTDGEEAGLLGAKAFADLYPWARDVGVVLNFDARGTTGPCLMFETSPENGRLIEAFAHSAPHPIASSLFYAVYRRLPNNTDFTEFRDRGDAGLNFAFIEGVSRYHTQLDNIAHVDRRSLQHDGMTMLALTRRLGAMPLDDLRAGDAVFFDVLGRWVVHYPQSWALPLAIVAAAGFVSLWVYGFRTRRLTPAGSVFGAVALLLGLVLVLILTVAWSLTRASWEYTHGLWGLLYVSPNLAAGFVLLAIAASLTCLIWLPQRIDVLDRMAGAQACWAVLALAAALLLPGGSYLPVWPLLFGLLAFGVMLRIPAGGLRAGPRATMPAIGAVLALSALPAVLLIVPILRLLFAALSIAAFGPITLLIVLLAGLLIPHLGLIAPQRPWLPALMLLFTGLGLFAAGSLHPDFDAEHPQTDSLFYGLNADTGKAVWASADVAPDAWTTAFLGEHPQASGSLPDFLPDGSQTFLQHAAPAAALVAPRLERVSDHTSGGVRTLALRLISPRHARMMEVAVDPTIRVLSADLDSAPIPGTGASVPGEREGPWSLFDLMVEDRGITLTLHLSPPRPVKIHLIDRSYGLPLLHGKGRSPRPPSIIPTPAAGWYQDCTFVSRSWRL